MPNGLAPLPDIGVFPSNIAGTYARSYAGVPDYGDAPGQVNVITCQ
jgi:hypothetical protein